MAYPMFGQLTVAQCSEKDFNLDFSIPDNCSYRVTSTAGNYNISVTLNPGQNSPSTTFMECSETVSSSSSSLLVNVSQYEKSGNIIKRPKLSVEY